MLWPVCGMSPCVLTCLVIVPLLLLCLILQGYIEFRATMNDCWSLSTNSMPVCFVFYDSTCFVAFSNFSWYINVVLVLYCQLSSLIQSVCEIGRDVVFKRFEQEEAAGIVVRFLNMMPVSIFTPELEDMFYKIEREWDIRTCTLVDLTCNH